MPVPYVLDMCRMEPVAVPAGILYAVTGYRSDVLFPFLPDCCNETVYLVRVTPVYLIPAVMETVEALQAFHCIKVSKFHSVFYFHGILRFVCPTCHRTSVRFHLPP
jgi:hypothetical protein